jgi:hypothetical protein
MNGANHVQVAQAAMKVIDRLQLLPKEVQVLAATTVFMELTRLYRVRPQDAAGVVQNMISQDGRFSPEFRAVRQYIEKELR